jgi:hypothetical protein
VPSPGERGGRAGRSTTVIEVRLAGARRTAVREALGRGPYRLAGTVVDAAGSVASLERVAR